MRRFITLCWLIVLLATARPQAQVCGPGDLLLPDGMCHPGLKTYFPLVMR